ncbi:MAG: hypothetical protein P3A33_09870 [Gemmatimonadota bacterium]|jgi:hypothetical protein|nr:hypothetical protein [Gemmatimonadota bacterium]
MYGVPGIPMVGGGQAGVPPVSFELPKNVFRFGEQTLWSSQFFAGNSALANGTFRMFTTPLGQQGQGFAAAMSISETNIKEGGRIPSGIAFDTFGIAVQQIATSNQQDVGTNVGVAVDTAAEITDLVNLQNNGVIVWDFTQTQVEVCPVMLAGSGGGAFGTLSASQDPAAVGAVTASLGNVSNGNGSIWLYRKHPVALPGNSTFSIVLRFGSRAATVQANGLIVRVVLLGYYKNVIEIA